VRQKGRIVSVAVTQPGQCGVRPRRRPEIQKSRLPEEQTRPDVAPKTGAVEGLPGKIALVFIDERWVKTNMAHLRG